MNQQPDLAAPSTLLGGLSIEAFLRDYWQQKPLLIRGAVPGFEGPLSPEELAGLAMEPDVEARIIRELDSAPGWELEHGPFTEAQFLGQPESHWTLLVQGMNRLHPEVAELLEAFRFIPDWRLDDIMVSYAAPGGSVGPHTDQYDVFLLQGPGRRRWQIGDGPLEDGDRLLPDLPLRILSRFVPDQSWDLGPGDMLYLPPGVPHHGVALDPCLTYSVGFRAPTEQALLSGFADHLLDQWDPAARFADPGRSPQANPALVDERSRAAVRELLRRAVADDVAIDRWFARFLTEPLDSGLDMTPEPPLDEGDIIARLRGGKALWRSEFSRFAYLDDPPRLYVDGEEYADDGERGALLALLAERRRPTAETLLARLSTAPARHLLATLVNGGALYFPEE